MNKYFDKIFCISLFDNNTRWRHVEKQFKQRKIKIDRFVGVDGRCKQDCREGCIDKLKNFEIAYNVTIPKNVFRRKFEKLKVTVPATSLTLGTLLILRAVVRNKWKRVLICEDDINLVEDFVSRFKLGVKEMGNKKWDLLYLGCAGGCGTIGISEEQDQLHPHPCTWEYAYCAHPDDLRGYCDDCVRVSNSISTAVDPGGTWCYAVSYEGALKLLRIIEQDPTQHIDTIYRTATYDGIISAYAFDPPIAYHENISQGRVTDIPW